MKIYHKEEYVDNSLQIVLYVEYPDDYEFGIDFDKIKKNVNDVADKIRAYALKNIGGIKDNTVLLVLNGVVIGTLLVSQLTTVKPKDINNTPTNVIEESHALENVGQKAENNSENKEENNSENAEKSQDETVQEAEENNKNTNVASTETINKNNNTSAPIKNNSNTSSKPAANNKPSNNTNNNNSYSPPVSNEPAPPQPSGKMVSVRLASGQVISIDLEEYIVGVVAGEMPASFNSEALKAQSVAARTYALRKTAGGGILSATTADQVYKTNDQLKAQWGSSYTTYYNKVKNAVNATRGKYMTYNGTYIEALYFSTSNGRTEDAINVWGNSIPYLKSVESPWDTKASAYFRTQRVSKQTISSKLGVDLTSISQMSIDSRTSGNRVKNITICGKTFTGVEIRSKLGLRSADFDISESGNDIVFSVRGYGHGVGMSQYGAHYMAAAGYNYIQILNHYYTGIQIKG